MGLFDAMGGREWVRAIGGRLDGPTTNFEVKLELPDGSGPNRANVSMKRKGGEVVIQFGRIDGDDGEDMGSFTVRKPEEAARLVEELVAASVAKGKAKHGEGQPQAEQVAA